MALAYGTLHMRSRHSGLLGRSSATCFSGNDEDADTTWATTALRATTPVVPGNPTPLVSHLMRYANLRYALFVRLRIQPWTVIGDIRVIKTECQIFRRLSQPIGRPDHPKP